MKFNLDFKSINFDLKKQLLHILETTSIQGNLNCSLVNNNSQCLTRGSEEDANIIISNDPHVTPSGCRVRVLA